MFSPYDDDLETGTTDDAADAPMSEYDDLGDEVAERRVGSEPIPGFGFYVLTPKGATAAFAFEDKERPILRHRIEVVEGPEGTVGRTFFVDQPMAVKRTKWTDQKDANGRPIFDPLPADEQAEEIRKFKLVLNRVAQVFGFAMKAPKDKSLGAIGLYAAQFEKAGEAGVQFVGEVKKNTRNGFTKNLIYFDSIAAVTDSPSADYRGKAKRALDEAREKIEAKNKLIDAADKKAGRPARGNAKATTTASSAQSLD